MTDTYKLGIAIATLQRALADAPDEETGEIVDPAVASENVEELLDAVLRAAVEAEDMADMGKRRAEEVKARSDRYKAKADNLRSCAFAAMVELDIKKRELPDLTASIRQNAPRLVITDETLIPDLYWRNPPPVIDKASLGSVIKGGATIPGAELSNALPSLSIKVK
jgi:hypothetical protein